MAVVFKLNNRKVTMFVKEIKMFLVTYPLTILMDLLWVKVIMRDYYRENFMNFIEKLQMQPFRVQYAPGFIAWMLLVFGLMLFVLPLVRGKGLSLIFLHGAFFGLLVYGLYDFTNAATIVGWPMQFAMVDISWGMILCGLVTCVLSYLDTVL